MPTRDQDLTDGGVFFLPWIGARYEDGFHGRRVLVLGESHYNVWCGERHELAPSFTRECIAEVIERIDGAPFWKNVEQALLNEYREEHPNGGRWAPSGGKNLWDRLSFYNFIQTPVEGGPGDRPTPQQFIDGDAPFRRVLEILLPDRVWVCGKALMNGMGATVEAPHRDLQAFSFDNGTKLWCFATVHPSFRFFSWKREHPRIMEFLVDPQKTAESLR